MKAKELETPIQQILEGIDTFNDRVKNRIKSKEWDTAHIQKLNNIRKDLFDTQIDLEELRQETW